VRRIRRCDVTCDACGVELHIGDFPFCPHGSARSGRGADVTWPGGRTFENLGNEPQTFYSPGELNKYLKAHNLESFVRHQPVPGTDKSPHTTSWAAVSQHQLDGATAMLERVGNGKDATPTWVQSLTLTEVVESGTVTAPRGTFDAR
jgi:hypothetical protein